jgi:dihydrofolate reductase
MRKVIFSIPITLDGFIEGPHQELDWVIADDELHDFYSDLLNTSDLILYGRVTYELMANYWPTATDDPTISMGMLRFANTLNPMKKIVFSKTLRNAGWNTQVDKFNPDEIMKMKTRPGGDILLGGGASIAKLFIEYGLIDEYQLVVQPVAIGEGTSLFGGIKDMHKLEYLWYRPFQSGAVALCYRPNGKV